MLSRIIVLATLAVLTLGTSAKAQAQPADNRTYFTFRGPVTLPGVTLPAGRYLFRLADANTGVINVLSEDGKKSYAMLLTIPNQLLQPSLKPEIRFMETAANMPPAIKAWSNPGRSTGWEFIYPRQQALLLAKASGEPVLTTGAPSEDLKATNLTRVSGSGEQAPVIGKEPAAGADRRRSAARGQFARADRTQQAEVASGSNPLAGEPSAAASGGAGQGTAASDVNGSSATSAAAQSTAADESAQTSAGTELTRTASWLSPLLLVPLIVVGVGVYLWRRYVV